MIAKTSWIFVSNSSRGPVRVGGAAPQQPPALPEAERGREAERPRGGEAVREQRGGAEGEPDKLIQQLIKTSVSCFSGEQKQRPEVVRRVRENPGPGSVMNTS